MSELTDETRWMLQIGDADAVDMGTEDEAMSAYNVAILDSANDGLEIRVAEIVTKVIRTRVVE